MIQLIGKNRSRVWTMLSAVFLLLVCLETAWAAPLLVRVQPSGDSFAKAYVITGEARSYFGNVEGGTGPYQYKWEFTDGAGDTGFQTVSNPRYIAYDGKVFDSAGTKFARLTVRDSGDPQLTASATINLQVLSMVNDDLIRKKNSAIDNGLRYTYQQEDVGCSTNAGGGNYFSNSGANSAYIAGSVVGAKATISYTYYFGAAVCPGTFTVNWGDGTVESVAGSNYYCGYPYAYIENISHTYASSGNFTISASHDGTAANPYISVAVTAVVGDTEAKASCWPGSGGAVGATGMSLIAFENHGHNLQSPDSDIYKKPVQRGVQYLLDKATKQSIGSQTYIGDPEANDGDSDNDATGVLIGNNDMYVASVGVLALVNSCDETYAKGHVVTTAGDVNGMTLWDVGVDSKDWLVWAQNENGTGRGGWRYGSNSYDSDNSATQWPVLALQEAKSRWNINVNPLVVTELNRWLAYSQNTDGGFGYTAPSEWVNFPKTAAGLIMLNYAGKALADAPVQSTLNYLNNNWSSENLGYMYSMYANYKAMKIWKLSTLGSHSWGTEYDTYLIDNQASNGGWAASSWTDAPFSSYMSVAILAPEVYSLPPVANAGGPYPEVNANQNVSLNGGSSYHQDPAKSLVKWEWDFNDADGLWWDTKSAPAAGEGAVGMTASVAYPDTGNNESYTVTLRVTDNTAPTALTDTSTAAVSVTSGNVPPVAVTNGPWSALPGQLLTFDGSASYDPNACSAGSDPQCLNDSIVKYEWDLDGNGVFNEPDVDGVPVTAGDYRIVTKSFATPVSLPATLRVTDSHGKVGVSSASFNIVSVALVFGQKYEICYKTTLNRYQERQGIQVKFKNFGNGTAENLKMILTQLPANLTVSNNKSFSMLGTLGAGEEKATACNPANKTADIELIFDRRVVPTGDWRWRSEFDLGGNHYTVDNIPPLAP